MPTHTACRVPTRTACRVYLYNIFISVSPSDAENQAARSHQLPHQGHQNRSHGNREDEGASERSREAGRLAVQVSAALGVSRGLSECELN